MAGIAADPNETFGRYVVTVMKGLPEDRRHLCEELIIMVLQGCRRGNEVVVIEHKA